MTKAERADVDHKHGRRSQYDRPETALSSSPGPTAGLQLIEEISFPTLEWDSSGRYLKIGCQSRDLCLDSNNLGFLHTLRSHRSQSLRGWIQTDAGHVSLSDVVSAMALSIARERLT